MHIPGTAILMSSYALVLAFYFVFALSVVSVLCRRLMIPMDVMLPAFALGVPIGIIGARLLDALEYADRYPTLAALFGRNGSSIYGALLLNLAFTAMFVKARGVPVSRFLDAGAPAMALGETMSRIGCFLNGCCYGTPTTLPWAVSFPRGSFALDDQLLRGIVAPTADHTVPVHPVQLYSAAIMLIVFGLLFVYVWSRPPAGRAFWFFLVGYGCLRLGMMPLRTENLQSMVGFSIGFVALGMLGVGWSIAGGSAPRQPPIGDGRRRS